MKGGDEDAGPLTFPEDEGEIDENAAGTADVLAAYLADGQTTSAEGPVYDEELGLAMEKIKEGYSVKSLWEVIPST